MYHYTFYIIPEFLIRITRPYASNGIHCHSDHYLTFVEIEIFDTLNNKLTLNVYDYSSQEDSHPVTSTIDGTSSYTWAEFGLTTDHYFEYKITNNVLYTDLLYIKLQNRDSPCSHRIVSSYIDLYQYGVIQNTEKKKIPNPKNFWMKKNFSIRISNIFG